MKIVKPNRVTRTCTQRLVAAPAAVFPLLCPVREADWIDGWNPPLAISSSGIAAFPEDHYRGLMQGWEARINRYLRHGTSLRATND